MGTTDTLNSAHCIDCNYSLRGLSSSVCPECGRRFDPTDPLSVNTGRPVGKLGRLLLRRTGWFLPTLSIVVLAALIYTSSLRGLAPTPSRAEWRILHEAYDNRVAWQWTTEFDRHDYILLVAALVLALTTVLWTLRAFLRFSTRLLLRPGPALVPPQRKRQTLVLLTLCAASALVLFGWPYRFARHWTRLEASHPGAWHVPYLLIDPDHAGMRRTLRVAVLELPEPRQRIAALNLLMRHRGNEALDILLRAVVREPDPTVRRAELWLIALHADATHAPSVERFLDHEDPSTRATAADAIGILFGPAYEIPISPPDVWSTPPLAELAIDSPIDLTSLLEAVRLKRGSVGPPIGPSPALLQKLTNMMLHGPTLAEREAAARALLPWPPQGYHLRYAEWGVWQSDASNSRMKSNAEIQFSQIPPFVYDTAAAARAAQMRVTYTGMDIFKPVIHLTASPALSADVQVLIDSGQPWFAYPKPDDITLRVADGAPVPVISPPDRDRVAPAGRFKSLDDIREGYPFLSPSHRTYEVNAGGFIPSPKRVGAIGLRWQSLIVSPQQLPWMQLPSTGGDPRYQWWTRLRDVPCSYVSSRGESERFLYYDGPTKNRPPGSAWLRGEMLELDHDERRWAGDAAARLLKVRGAAVVGYRDQQALFVRVDPSGKCSAWFLDIPADDTWLANRGFCRFTIPKSLPLAAGAVPTRFLQMLTDAGLTREEAAGLCFAWDKEFFRTPGTRLLLRMSPADYDAQCPLTLRPAPTELVRVGILWTELGMAP